MLAVADATSTTVVDDPNFTLAAVVGDGMAFP
jgi:hypothetical protein